MFQGIYGTFVKNITIMEILLEAVSESLQYTGVKLKNHFGFKIERGKHYAIIGENGAGKTTLGKIIEKGWNIGTNDIHGDKNKLKIKSIEFSDIHSLSGCKDGYYQQRFEATMNDGMPTVDEIISNKIPLERWEELCERLSLKEIRHKKINFLSSGELRKFLIINLFTEIPDILIIDNPYIGLDADSRELFNSLIKSVGDSGTAILLLLCNPIDVPDFTDYILPMQNKEILQIYKVEDVGCNMEYLESLFNARINVDMLPLIDTPDVEYDIAFELKNCDVKYGNTVILKDVSWQVKAGENWALLGENGAGKSTLLSLVCADNPQGYKNEITIFDKRRGTGESIWDIKRRIAYISPEMHLYFNDAEDVLRVVTSGLQVHVGCFRRPSDSERELAMRWLDAFGVASLASRRFPTLSSGEQRLVLLARTFIKGAPVLILDEPLHGLDAARKKLIAAIIETVTGNGSTSLVYVTHYINEIPACVGNTFRLRKHFNK